MNPPSCNFSCGWGIIYFMLIFHFACDIFSRNALLGYLYEEVCLMIIETERNSQAQANPVFMTAKTAICLMAAADISDASAIVRCLGLENHAPLQNVTGPLCITTEGMMMYFDAHEADTVVSNIRAMLEQHGGLWITSDPEFILQFFYSFRSIFGKDSPAKLAASKESAQQQANVASLSNPLIINPDDIIRSTKTAEDFINSHGMKVKKITLAEHIPNLSIYRQLTQEQIRNFKTAMNDCHYWIITLDEQRQPADNAEQQATPFEMNYALENNMFKVSIDGRLDSLTAPQLLTAWEKIKTTRMPVGAEIDCAKLGYITSAGIRVFLILQKALGKNLALTNVHSSMEKLFIQKGFTVPPLQ